MVESQLQNGVIVLLITGPDISSLGKVPIEILPGKRHITWVLAMLLLRAEFQIEVLPPYAISYHTGLATN